MDDKIVFFLCHDTILLRISVIKKNRRPRIWAASFVHHFSAAAVKSQSGSSFAFRLEPWSRRVLWAGPGSSSSSLSRRAPANRTGQKEREKEQWAACLSRGILPSYRAYMPMPSNDAVSNCSIDARNISALPSQPTQYIMHIRKWHKTSFLMNRDRRLSKKRNFKLTLKWKRENYLDTSWESQKKAPYRRTISRSKLGELSFSPQRDTLHARNLYHQKTYTYA